MDIRDERGVIVSWLVRLLIGLAVVAVVLFDAGSIAVNFFGLDSTADEIAVAVSLGIQSGEPVDQQDLEAQATALATEADAKLVKVELDDEGRVHVHLKRVAKTLIVRLIGPAKHWARARAEGIAGST
ncbi:MAG: hypothetical protein ACR2L3_04835 [Actinomycetota bacterium]